MPSLTRLLVFVLGGAIIGAVGIGALVLPLITAERVRSELPTNPASNEVACWGCAPFERLQSLFQLQELAATPRIRQFERELARGNLTSTERQVATSGLRTAQYRLQSAEAARVALDDAIDACEADDACRRNPESFHEQTCTGPWPDEATNDRLTSLASRIYEAGASCRDMSCPSLNCEARTGLQAVLNELTETLGGYTGAEARSAPARAALAPMVAELRAALERLPLALSQRQPDAFAAWAERTSEIPFLQSADERVNLVGPEPGWRLRVVGLHFGALLTMVTDERASGEDWRAIAERAGAALAQLHYLEWLVSLDDDGAQCEVVRGDILEGVAGDLRRAAAALAVCGARSGCAAGGDALSLVNLYDRAPVGLGGLERFTSEATTALLRNLETLALEAEPQIVFSTDINRYGVGEAIRALAAPTSNRCIAEPGARIALFRAGSAGGALETRNVRAFDESFGALIAAPEIPGTYEVRALAASERGEGELARHVISVDPAPSACEGFSGLWQTNFGELRLYVRDGAVRGTYRRSPDVDPGFLTGEVRGPVFYGEWESELGDGGARLVLADDGASFSGAWSHIPGRYTGTGRWTGQCLLEVSVDE